MKSYSRKCRAVSVNMDSILPARDEGQIGSGSLSSLSRRIEPNTFGCCGSAWNRMSGSRCGCWISFILTVGLTGCQREATADTPAVAAKPAPIQNPGPRTNLVDGAEMVFIPPGEFLMGSDQEELDRIWKKFTWRGEEI